ncbi:perilipin-3-like [Notamacropus eugenii]|uniref:perilipin-3-like n=1 Tax=Notamacropus eugenii TaxID=9315 RepID=UPI003B67B80E
MDRPQELHSSKEMEVQPSQPSQPSQETDSLVHDSSGDSDKQDSTSVNSVTTSVSREEKILSEIQKGKQTLEELKLYMDKYLPISLDMVNIQASSEEDEDCFKENSSRDKGTSLGSLPSNLQAHKNIVENIRDVKNKIRKLSYQLYEVIELTYQCKQDSEDRQNYYKALFEMWSKWIKNQCEGDTQLLEALTLDMFRSIALKLQLAFMDLMPKVQGLPSSLQDNLQQACCDMQELHSTFSKSGRFQDLDKHHLTQSQFKLTQAQGSIEKLFCFLENSIP